MTANTTTDRTVSTNDPATFRDLKRRLLVNGLYIFPNPSTQVNGLLVHEAGHVQAIGFYRGATLWLVRVIRHPAPPYMT